MKLSVALRIRLLGILPDKGNILTLKVIQQLRDDMSFSEKELKDWGIKSEKNVILWNKKAKEKEVGIGDSGLEIIINKLKALDEKSELTAADIALWDLFVGEK